jgi:hypothetical protein
VTARRSFNPEGRPHRHLWGTGLWTSRAVASTSGSAKNRGSFSARSPADSRFGAVREALGPPSGLKHATISLVTFGPIDPHDSDQSATC